MPPKASKKRTEPPKARVKKDKKTTNPKKRSKTQKTKEPDFIEAEAIETSDEEVTDCQLYDAKHEWKESVLAAKTQIVICSDLKNIDLGKVEIIVFTNGQRANQFIVVRRYTNNLDKETGSSVSRDSSEMINLELSKMRYCEVKRYGDQLVIEYQKMQFGAEPPNVEPISFHRASVSDGMVYEFSEDFIISLWSNDPNRHLTMYYNNDQREALEPPFCEMEYFNVVLESFRDDGDTHIAATLSFGTVLESEEQFPETQDIGSPPREVPTAVEGILSPVPNPNQPGYDNPHPGSPRGSPKSSPILGSPAGRTPTDAIELN